MNINLILTISLTILVIVLFITFLIRTKVVLVMAISIRAMFFAMALTAVTAIYIPAPFHFVADQAFRATGTYQSLESVDSEINKFASSPLELVNSIRKLLGQKPETVQTDVKILAENVYPNLIQTSGELLRIVVLISSIMMLVTLIYLSYTTSAASDLAFLQLKYQDLEKRLQQIEATQTSNTQTGSVL